MASGQWPLASIQGSIEVTRVAPDHVAPDRVKESTGMPPHHTALGSFVEQVLNHPLPSSLRLDIRPVRDTEANDIADSTGLDGRGFMHSIDGSVVGHILRSHGNETRGGQEPITPDDIKQIGSVIDSYDAVDLDPNSAAGAPAIRFRKQVNGHLFVVEATRIGRRQKGTKRLAVTSMYKYKSGPPEPHPTPEAT